MCHVTIARNWVISPESDTQCPAYHVSCHNCKKLGHFSRVCHSKPIQPHPPRPYTSTLQSTQSDSSWSGQAGLSNIHHVTSTDPAPKLKIDITTLNGAITTAVLPDSGADISAASTSILSQLNEHIDNLLHSSVIPKAANGAEMHPVDRLPVCFKIGNKEHLDDLTLNDLQDKVISMGGRQLSGHGLPQPRMVDNDRFAREYRREINYDQVEQ